MMGVMTFQTLTNENAIAARAAIEPEAFAELYDFYFPHIYTYIRVRVQDDATADDLTAQTFERALTKIQQYRPEKAPFGAWLFGIARNMVSNHRRSERRHPWLSLDFFHQKPANVPHPEEAAVHHQVHERLLQALSELKEQEKDLIALKYIAGFNNRTIAAMTGLSESNVGVILFRAMRRLKERLNQEKNQ